MVSERIKLENYNGVLYCDALMDDEFSMGDLNIIRDERKHNEVYGDDIFMKIAAYETSEHRANISDLLDRIFRTEKKLTREIAVYHYVDGMTLQEVANETDMSISGVRKRIRELRRRIEIKKEIYHEH